MAPCCKRQSTLAVPSPPIPKLAAFKGLKCFSQSCQSQPAVMESPITNKRFAAAAGAGAARAREDRREILSARAGGPDRRAQKAVRYPKRPAAAAKMQGLQAPHQRQHLTQVEPQAHQKHMVMSKQGNPSPNRGKQFIQDKKSFILDQQTHAVGSQSGSRLL